MALFKSLVRNKRSDGFYQVYIRVTHQRKALYIKTDKVVDQKGVDKNKGIKDPYVLQYCSNKISQYMDILNKKDISKWTVDEVVKFLLEGTSDISFSDYAREYQAKMIQDGHARNARTYELAYQNLERYAGTTRLMFSHMTSTFITRWIKTLSNTARAKEQYPICVRQIYKQALLDFNDYDTGMIRITTDPWYKVKIPKSDASDHKAITMEECRAFFHAPLPESDRKYPLSELGRDVAMMILCLAGINTVDLYYAEKKNYKNSILGYNRRKTRFTRTDKAWFEIQVPDIINPLIEKYLDKSDSPYLFVFHKRHSTYDSFNANVNIGIRQICEDVLGIEHEKAYSGYTFRHTWATVAQNECGATLADVDFGLNHANKTKLARTYVKLDFSPAWELNNKVIEKIFFTEEKSKNHNFKENQQSLFRISKKQQIKAYLYFKGKIISKIHDIGYNNVEQVIKKLMKDLPEDIPPRSMVLIRITNLDHNITQDYNRMIK